MTVYFSKNALSLPAENGGADNVIEFPAHTEQTTAQKAHEHSFQFRLVANHSDASPKSCEESWQKFVPRLHQPEVRGPLSLEEYLIANSDDQDAQKNGPGFVPAVFDGNGRADKNVTAVTGIGLDFDNKSGPPVDRGYIEARLKGHTYAAHTTYSHSKERQRWRVIVPFLKPLSPGKLPAVYDYFKQLLPDVLDTACMNASRLFYLPACPPGGESIYEWFASEGKLFDPSALPDLPSTTASHTPSDEKITKGKRNVTLTSIAGSLRRRGLDETSIRAALDAINQTSCEPPLPEAQVAKIAKSVSNYLPPSQIVVAEYTAAELAKKNIPEPIWIVPDLISTGLSLLAGKPKIGKSWLTLAIAIAVSNGTQVLGIPVEAMGVLYLALEDNQQRLKKRLLVLLGDDKPSERLHFVNAWKPLAEGGLADLEARIAADPTIRLVVIDTLGRVRKSSKPGGNIYLEDYETIANLKAVADKFQVAVLCVHHTRKAPSSDPFETISGTTGLTGAADTNMVLSRAGMPETVLHVNGRDVEEQHLAMKFNNGAWQVLGPAAKVCISKNQQKVMTALTEAQMGPKDVATKTGLPLDSVKKDLKKLVDAGHLVHLDHGLYGHPSPPSP